MAAIADSKVALLAIGFVGGCLVGMFALSGMFHVGTPAPPGDEDLRPLREAHGELQGELAESLLAFAGVVRAEVHISVPRTIEEAPTASVLLSLADGAELSPTQVEGMATLVSGAVAGMLPGDVSVVDTSGRELNLESRQQLEQKQFWTRLAINVAKILGILSVLITLRLILKAVGPRLIGKK